jgi:hypothetical protein
MLDGYLTRESVRAWLSQHQARVAARELTDVFHEFLLRVWGTGGSKPDWRRLEAQELKVDSPDLWDVVARSRLGAFDEAFLIFSADEPGILAPMRELVEGLEAVAPPYPEASFVCGATATADAGGTIDPTAFLGYDGMDTVFLVNRVPPSVLE